MVQEERARAASPKLKAMSSPATRPWIFQVCDHCVQQSDLEIWSLVGLHCNFAWEAIVLNLFPLHLASAKWVCRGQ